MNQPRPTDLALARAERDKALADLAAERQAKTTVELSLSKVSEAFRAARRAKLERSDPWPDPLDPISDTLPEVADE